MDPGLKKLIHAAVYLKSETGLPVTALPGVHFALREIEKAKKNFYSNAPHRTNRCLRCSELVAVQQLAKAAH